MTYLVPAVAAALLVQSLCLWRVSRRLQQLLQLEAKLASFGHSLTLLTDTTEGCFQALAAELASSGARSHARGSRQRRVVNAARRNQTVERIAAEEDLALSEVQLRLAMAKQGSAAQGEDGGSLRS